MFERTGRLGAAAPTIGIWSVAALVTVLFGWIVADVLWQGAGELSWTYFWATPQNGGREGGIGPILVSTLAILAVCLSVALPIGLGTAVLLAEFLPSNSVFGRLTRRSLDTLAGVPSIVFGLFGNALFSTLLGLGFSIVSGGLTLACMVLPLLIRTAEEGLRSVSAEYTLSAAAIGLSRPTRLRRVILPLSAPALVAGVVLSVGRALAETAALIFTSGYVDRMPRSIWDSGRSLSVHIYDLAMNVPGGGRRAAAAAVVLIALVVACNQLAGWVASRAWRVRLQKGG